MGTGIVVPAKEFFDEGVRISVSRLLSLLRQKFDMDVAFIGKFEGGLRTTIFVDYKEGCEFPEGEPLCHAENDTYCKKIAEGVLPPIIPDASINPITREMPVTEELSIGSYIGVPLYLSDGTLYGAMCCMKKCIDSSLNERDPSLLSFVADVIADRIEIYQDSQQQVDEIRRRLRDLIDKQQLEMYFQPIWSLESESTVGFEALARFQTEPYRSPDVWFAEANEIGESEALELMALQLAVDQLPNLPEHCFLSINVSPELLLSSNIEKHIRREDAHRIVLEITEHSKISSYLELRDTIHCLRKMGVRIAIDDAGSGYASFQHVVEMDADIIKLDLNLIRNIHVDMKKQALASALVSYARCVKAVVVAEGVETQEEFNMLRQLGVDKVQGYLIGKPASLSAIS